MERIKWCALKISEGKVITAGLGAGFGGAFVMMNNVLSVAWEPSGILGVIVMRLGCMLNYVIGILIAAVGGFVVTFLVMRKKDVGEENEKEGSIYMCS